MEKYCCIRVENFATILRIYTMTDTGRLSDAEDLRAKLKGTCLFLVGMMGSGKSTVGWNHLSILTKTIDSYLLNNIITVFDFREVDRREVVVSIHRYRWSRRVHDRYAYCRFLCRRFECMYACIYTVCMHLIKRIVLSIIHESNP